MHSDDLYINKTKKPLCPEEPTINRLSAAISITWAGLLCPCVIKLKIVAESFNSAVSSAGEGWIQAPALQLAVLASSPAPLQSLAAGITSRQDGAERAFTIAFCLLVLQINPSLFSFFFFFSSYSLSAGRAWNSHIQRPIPVRGGDTHRNRFSFGQCCLEFLGAKHSDWHVLLLIVQSLLRQNSCYLLRAFCPSRETGSILQQSVQTSIFQF